MGRKLTVFYTGDCHGNFDGLSRCSASFARSGNALLMDGGDTLHGSPLTYYLYRQRKPDGVSVPAAAMNAVGYHFITLGNHDFSFGRGALDEYLDQLDAVCLCANMTGQDRAKKTSVITLENGLRVGITGITSTSIPCFETEDHLSGLQFSDAFSAAKEAYRELSEAHADITVCVYHGGYEMPPEEYVPGETDIPSDILSENQGLKIASELQFDILLTAHQHKAFSGKMICGTYTCQIPEKCAGYIRLEADENGEISAELIAAGEEKDGTVSDIIRPAEEEMQTWMNSTAGFLDTELIPEEPLKMAADGSMIANFLNQIQLDASGADISCTALGNSQSGFSRAVSNMEIICGYQYANTLEVLCVNRKILKAAIERSAEFFACDASGNLCVSRAFLEPMVQFFNYDFYSGIEYVLDPHRPCGERVISIRFKGEELPEDKWLNLCLNSYRAAGNGGYPFFGNAETVLRGKTEIQELIFTYMKKYGNVCVDRKKWITVL